MVVVGGGETMECSQHRGFAYQSCVSYRRSISERLEYSHIRENNDTLSRAEAGSCYENLDATGGAKASKTGILQTIILNL